MIDLVPHLIYVLARGGGGGSGGGGGGGGGGSSGGGSGSGSGGGFILLIIAGFIPMYALGSIIRRKDKLESGKSITWSITAVLSILLVVAFRGYGILLAIGAFLGSAAGLYGWFSKVKINYRAKQELKTAESKDKSWDEVQLKDYVTNIFIKFQNDWSKGDTESMKSYLSPAYHNHISLMMAALKQAFRVNMVNNPKIKTLEIQDVTDSQENSNDRFVMGIDAVAQDQLIDSRDNKVLFEDNNSFVENWHFVKSDSTWRLEGIRQVTENILTASTDIETFAKNNNLCYSLDWGWLLLPKNGQIFSGGKFGSADINNHCIGIYNNMLIQIYSYIANPAQQYNQLLVAQVQLPKSYGDIVVRRKKGFGWSNIRGLSKIEMEWGEFNKKYEVFASTAEGPTSFELLHPVFMEVLERQPFEINLEVVDNVVYFYANQRSLTPEHYPVMLSVLQEAFKQMKM